MAAKDCYVPRCGDLQGHSHAPDQGNGPECGKLEGLFRTYKGLFPLHTCKNARTVEGRAGCEKSIVPETNFICRP